MGHNYLEQQMVVNSYLEANILCHSYLERKNTGKRSYLDQNRGHGYLEPKHTAAQLVQSHKLNQEHLTSTQNNIILCDTWRFYMTVEIHGIYMYVFTAMKIMSVSLYVRERKIIIVDYHMAESQNDVFWNLVAE